MWSAGRTACRSPDGHHSTITSAVRRRRGRRRMASSTAAAGGIWRAGQLRDEHDTSRAISIGTARHVRACRRAGCECRWRRRRARLGSWALLFLRRRRAESDWPAVAPRHRSLLGGCRAHAFVCVWRRACVLCVYGAHSKMSLWSGRRAHADISPHAVNESD